MREGLADSAAKIRLAEQVAAQLAAIDGVVAVVLGGSLARGAGDSRSDVDLGLYYDPARPPDLVALRTLAQALDDRHAPDLVTPLGGWGPWINGGGWLDIGGQRVDWLYRDLAKVRAVIDACRAGKPEIHYQPGHPHGFHTAIYLAEVHACRPLHDPQGAVAGLKSLTEPYPPALQRAIVDGVWEADFALANAEKALGRGDVSYAAGCFFRCTATLAQALHALNARYCMNEKGAVRAVEGLPVRPDGFEARVAAAFAGLGAGPDGRSGAHASLRALTEETRALCLAGAWLSS